LNSFISSPIVLFTFNEFKEYGVLLGRTTISIKDETKKRFIKARGVMESSNGELRSEDDVLNELLGFYEKRREKPSAEVAVAVG